MDKQWGPFGIGQWLGHEGVYCRVCGWPVWSAWISDEPPPGTCIENKTAAIGCKSTLDRLKMQAWLRAATGFKSYHPVAEMLRGTTGLSWTEIENRSDKENRASISIKQLRELSEMTRPNTTEER